MSWLAPIGDFERVDQQTMLQFFQKQDTDTSLVDNVETLGFVRHFHNVLVCSSILDDLASASRLQDCHRSSVSTNLH